MGEIVKEEVVEGEEEGTTDDGFGDAFGKGSTEEVDEQGKEAEEAAGTGEEDEEGKDELEEGEGKEEQEGASGEEGKAAEEKGEAEAAEGIPDEDLLRAAEEAGQVLLDAQAAETAAIEEEEEEEEEEEVTPVAKPELAPAAIDGLTDDEKSLLADIPEFASTVGKVVLPQVRELVDKLVDVRIKQANLDEGQTERIQSLEETVVVLSENLNSMTFQVALSRVMPEGAETASSAGYQKWISEQSPQRQALHHSSSLSDAMLVLKLYQSTIKPSKPATEDKKKEERDDLIAKHGHSVSSGGGKSTGGARQKVATDDFAGAFAEGSTQKS